MTIARKHILSEESAVYHCVARCVRQSYLCGMDYKSGKNFDYRKEWVRDRLKLLVQVFSIETLNYALMSNHLHLLLKTFPELLEALSDLEIAKRWLKLYPPKPADYDEKLEKILNTQGRVNTLRRRLSSVSWFMKSLNEYIARRANKEDECKGRFWEGRFKCQLILGERSLLACAVYIDLNPIRAKMAKSLEESIFTSVAERISNYKNQKTESWLCPTADSHVRKGYLNMNFEDYLRIVEATGRLTRAGKRGVIPVDEESTLQKLGLEPKQWVDTTSNLGKAFGSVVGRKEDLRNKAEQFNRKWLKGLTYSEQAFG